VSFTVTGRPKWARNSALKGEKAPSKFYEEGARRWRKTEGNGRKGAGLQVRGTGGVWWCGSDFGKKKGV